MAILKPRKVSSCGSSANFTMAARAAVIIVPIRKLTAVAGAKSPLNASKEVPTAAKIIAEAPPGHAVTIQNSDTAPIVRKARNALTRAGSQSGTLIRLMPDHWKAPKGSLRSTTPFIACERSARVFAAPSASNRSDRVGEGIAYRAAEVVLDSSSNVVASFIQILASCSAKGF